MGRIVSQWTGGPHRPRGEGESRTKQAFAKDADINRILERFRKTGTLPPGKGVPEYLDVSEVGDYKTAMDQLIQAEEDFRMLPYDVREACDHNAGKFLDMMADPEDRKILESKGLKEAPPEPEPVVETEVEPASEA